MSPDLDGGNSIPSSTLPHRLLGHILRPHNLQEQVPDSQDDLTPSQDRFGVYCLDPPTSSPKTAADLFEPSQPALPGLAGYDSPLALARSRSSSPPEHHRPRRRPRSRAPSDSPEGDPDFDPRLATDRKPKRSSTLSPGAGLRPRKSARLSAHSTSPGTLPDLPATTVGGLGPEAAHGSCSGAAGPARRRSGEGRLACLRLWSMAWHADRGAFGCM